VGAPLLARAEPIYAMAGGVMLGGVLQLAVQVPVLRRLGLLPRIGVTWGAVRTAWQTQVRRILTLMAPALLGWGGAALADDQHPDRFVPGARQRDLAVLRRPLMEFPTALLGWRWAWC
jgi:putative peptidoglycan lipid II flippase